MADAAQAFWLIVIIFLVMSIRWTRAWSEAGKTYWLIVVIFLVLVALRWSGAVAPGGIFWGKGECGSANEADHRTGTTPGGRVYYYVERGDHRYVPCNSDWTDARR